MKAHCCPACLAVYDPFGDDWRVTRGEYGGGLIEHVHDGIRYTCDEVEVVDKAAHDGVRGAYEQAKADLDGLDPFYVSHGGSGPGGKDKAATWFKVEPPGEASIAEEVASLRRSGRIVLHVDPCTGAVGYLAPHDNAAPLPVPVQANDRWMHWWTPPGHAWMDRRRR